VNAHDGWIRSVAASLDGKTVVTAGNDLSIKLWSASDGSAAGKLEGHGRHVYQVAFHPTVKSLVSADLVGVIKQWDLAARKPTREFDGKVLWKFDPGFGADLGGPRGISFTPDGKLMACSGITDATNIFAGVGKPLVVLYDWASGKQARLLRPAADFQGVAWSILPHPSGIWIGLGGGGSGGRLWFWRGQETKSFHDVQLPLVGRGMDLHPDQRRLAVVGHDTNVRIYLLAAA
jgi:WD40 repeat protein